MTFQEFVHPLLGPDRVAAMVAVGSGAHFSATRCSGCCHARFR
ncbi:MAG: hypothetical protein F9K38_04030 [Pseudorhodoplanes sp.]|nr:MAG: hypothetical protein F9K38_04030 [Pseudorhodoplanes sp.]